MSAFLIFHLGLLKVAEEDFELKDYRKIRKRATVFYPKLMRSYIEKSMQIYIQSAFLTLESPTDSNYSEIDTEGRIVYKMKRPKPMKNWVDNDVKNFI